MRGARPGYWTKTRLLAGLCLVMLGLVLACGPLLGLANQTATLFGWPIMYAGWMLPIILCPLLLFVLSTLQDGLDHSHGVAEDD